MKPILRIKTFVLFCICAIVFFFTASVFVNYQHLVGHHERLFGLVPKLDLNGEQNLPTYYQVFTLLLAGMLAGVIASDKRRSKQKFAGRWTGLSAIFTLMSVDEFASLHEMFGDMVANKIHSAGHFDLPWLLFAVPVVLLIGFSYLGFVIGLPARDRLRFIWAGAFYLTGVIVIESIGGRYSALHGEENMTFVLVSNVEEVFEMVGVLLLNTALLKYICSYIQGSEIAIKVAGD